MKFRTSHTSLKADLSIAFNQPLFFAGSCFAENIAKKFQSHYWDVLENPIGISYNPISLFQQICLQKSPDSNEWDNNQGVFSHPDFHSELNAISIELAQQKLSDAIEKQIAYLDKCSVLFLTLGTAWVHIRKRDNYLVNNCHKQAAQLFEKRLLSVDEIVKAWGTCLAELEKKYQKTFQVVFTVSPVRHLKDGFRENQISKSILHLACERMTQTANCFYFPAYEIMLDDLRDYRFYKEDLIHPNQQAIEYIWKYFQEAYFDEGVKKKWKELENLISASNHRAFHQYSEQHQKFLKNLIEKINLFQKKNNIELGSLIQRLNQQLLAN